MEEKTKTQELNPIEPVVKPPQHHLITTVIIFFALIATGAAFFFLGKSQSIKTNTLIPTIIPTILITPATASATTWKTYLNKKFNFTVEYPGDWTAVEYSNSKNGASFNNGSVLISAGRTTLDYLTAASLEEYVKVAGSEIQNYGKLASIKTVTTKSGAIGYSATWMVQPMAIGGNPPVGTSSESLPITFFAIPGNKTTLIRVTLEKEEDIAIYEKMITTVKVEAPLTPEPTVDEAAVLKNVIKKYISLKHKSDESALIITVSKVEGNYAKGGVTDGEGGGMWLASKEEGAWALVWDGNGTIDCSTFSLYPNFPTNMVPECYDSMKQDVINR